MSAIPPNEDSKLDRPDELTPPPATTETTTTSITTSLWPSVASQNDNENNDTYLVTDNEVNDIDCVMAASGSASDDRLISRKNSVTLDVSLQQDDNSDVEEYEISIVESHTPPHHDELRQYELVVDGSPITRDEKLGHDIEKISNGVYIGQEGEDKREDDNRDDLVLTELNLEIDKILNGDVESNEFDCINSENRQPDKQNNETPIHTATDDIAGGQEGMNEKQGIIADEKDTVYHHSVDVDHNNQLEEISTVIEIDIDENFTSDDARADLGHGEEEPTTIEIKIDQLKPSNDSTTTTTYQTIVETETPQHKESGKNGLEQGESESTSGNGSTLEVISAGEKTFPVANDDVEIEVAVDTSGPAEEVADKGDSQQDDETLQQRDMDSIEDQEAKEQVVASSIVSVEMPQVYDDVGDEAKQEKDAKIPVSSGSEQQSLAINEELEELDDDVAVFVPRQVVVNRNVDPRSRYSLQEELGRGKFGTVLKCVDQSSGIKLAAKFIHMSRREDREDVEREIEIMKCLQHKRLLQLYDAFDDGQNEMCLIMELVEGGELFERVIDKDFKLTEKIAAIFMRQICEGVEYMHEQNIVHLDMKPENILCVSKHSNRIKLIDFGLARRLEPNGKLQVLFGTPDFASPEVLSYDKVTFATDMWSVGVICYVLLSGLSPFMGDNDLETMSNVTRAAYDFEDEAFDPISESAKDFISKLLIKDQELRMTPNECLNHSWLTQASRKASNVNISGNGDEDFNQSLDKTKLRKYVVRRKWQKAIHAILALRRMGASF